MIENNKNNMPEVVEVHLTSLYLNHKLINKTLEKIEVLGGRFERHGLDGIDLFKGNHTIKKIDSKGKFMWFELEDSKGNILYILNTYGLEGEWGFIEKKHSNVVLKINDDHKKKKYNLYFTDSRNFGTLEITNKKSNLDDKLAKLAPDFLKTPFDDKELKKRMKDVMMLKNGKISDSRANREIVKVLMDQTSSTGIGSGIGNYLAAEILYDAKISPKKTLKEIVKNDKLIMDLAHSIKYVIKLSYVTGEIGYMEHIDDSVNKFVTKLRKKIKNDKNYIFNYHPEIELKDADFEFKVYRQKKDPLGNKVVGDEIIKGRTTYWVPTIQK